MGWRYRALRLLTRELHRRFSAAFVDPAAAQAAQLGRILAANAGTRFGAQHGFAGIGSPAEYQQRVPVQTWEDVEPWVERVKAGEDDVLTAERVGLFLRTSGSTGPAKFIPCTAGLEQETGDARAWWVARLVEEDDRAAAGEHLTVYSPEVEGYTAAGIPYGSNTGRIRNRQPALVRLGDPVPPAVFGVPEAATRYGLILRFALQAADLATFSTANPSTVLLLVQVLQEQAEPLLAELAQGTLAARPGLAESLRQALLPLLRPRPRRARQLLELLRREGRLAPPQVWPRLASLNCWRCGGADFYEPALRGWFGEVPIRDPGFSASEGFVAIPWTHRHPAGVLNVPGHFFEFLPAEAPVGERCRRPLLAHELAPGMVVRPLLTTSGGLYRYDLGDVARVEEPYLATPSLRFLHRAGRVLSITGEKVTEAQAVTAASLACARTGLALVDFTVGLELVTPPRYCLAAELAATTDAAPPAGDDPARAATDGWSTLAGAFDEELGRANVEYRAKRASLRLGAAVVRVLPAGAFGRWRAELLSQGAPDGQVKVPHLVLDFGEIVRLGRP